MSQMQSGKGDVLSCRAGETLTAFSVVTIDSGSTTGLHVTPWVTDTQVIIGVCLSGASSTGESVDVLLAAPTSKVRVGSVDIAAGDLVGPQTDNAGQITTRANPGTVTTAMVPSLGIALAAGSVSSIIEVLLQPLSQRPSDG